MGKPSYLPSRTARVVIAVTTVALFAVPLLSTLEYTLRDRDGHSLTHWADVLSPAKWDSTFAPIKVGLLNSLGLIVLTVAIVLLLVAPTMILVNLRFPRLRRVMGFLTLLPLTIPAVVLVVGLAPIYLVIGRALGTGAWTLALAYGITVLPFVFRSVQAAVDAIDLKTLAEAARSLGARWPQVALTVIAPNIRGGLLAASLISVAVVLGEYTIASLLNRQNLQTALVLVNRQDAYVAVVFSLLALAFCFVLLALIGRAGNLGGPRRREGTR
jgi:putative spermidine/putrescine transport system permease protein